jgi:HK97 family phage portal protein
MIHDVECPLFHPLVGVSPIYAAGWPAIQGLNIRRNSDKFFSNGSKPGGVLTAPGTIADSTAARLKDYWDTNFSGDNIGKVAVLGDGLKYEPMAMTAEQSQLIEQLRMTDEDIAKCFHMPRHKVGIGPDPTYSNIEALTLQYYTDCLQRHIEGLELKLSEGLELTTVPGRDLGVDFDLHGLIKMDSQAQMEFVAKGIEKAIFSPNEARRFFDLKPVTGGESPMLQQQMFSLEALAERDDEQPFVQPTAPPPAAGPTDSGEDTGEQQMSLSEWATARDNYRKEFAL